MLLIEVIFLIFLQMIYTSTLTNQVENQKSSILQQESTIINNQLDYDLEIGSELSTSDRLYNLAVQTGSEDNYGAAHLLLGSQLEELAKYANDIVELAVVEDGRILSQYDKSHIGNTNGIWNDENQAVVEQMYEEVVNKSESKEVPKYVCGTVPNTYGPSNENVIHFAFPIIGNRHSSSGFKDVLIVTFRLNGLDSFLSVYNDSSFAGNYITNDEGEILYTSDQQMTGKNISEYFNSTDIDVLSNSLEDYGLTLHIAVNTEELEKPLNRLYINSFTLYLFLLALLSVSIAPIIHRALRPAREIKSAMEKVRNGSLTAKIEIHGQNELWQLAEQYNQMVDSLQKQISLTQKENEEKLVQMRRATMAEKEALESQINAHFLCNTLNAINYDALERGQTQISMLLRKLSNILRYSFSHQYENVSIAQEMAWVEQYLYLQKFRRMDVFDYRIDYPKEYDEWPCIKLFLQPFVENSIYHGFEGRENGGKILITGEASEDRFKITISDNGCGMTPEKEQEIDRILDGTETKQMKAAHGLGIENACARLRMFYGEHFDITMQTQEGKGTTFTLFLPIPPDMLDQDESERSTE